MDIKRKLREGSEDRKIIYTAVILTETSHNNLLSAFVDNIPEGWKIFAHHMTISFGKTLEQIGLESFNGLYVDLKVTHLGESDDAIAVKVIGMKTMNKIPHITLAIPKGGKPVNSNNIPKDKWVPIKEELTITGKVTEKYNK